MFHKLNAFLLFEPMSASMSLIYVSCWYHRNLHIGGSRLFEEENMDKEDSIIGYLQ